MNIAILIILSLCLIALGAILGACVAIASFIGDSYRGGKRN